MHYAGVDLGFALEDSVEQEREERRTLESGTELCRSTIKESRSSP
jgi:hypothetical protein